MFPNLNSLLWLLTLIADLPSSGLQLLAVVQGWSSNQGHLQKTLPNQINNIPLLKNCLFIPHTFFKPPLHVSLSSLYCIVVFRLSVSLWTAQKSTLILNIIKMIFSSCLTQPQDTPIFEWTAFVDLLTLPEKIKINVAIVDV